MKKLRQQLLALSLMFGIMNAVQADDTPLAKEMDMISSSLKKLRKAESFGDKAALVREAQKGCWESMKHLPAIFKEITDKKELAEKTADYKRLMGLMYVRLAELELAYLKEDEEAARKAYDALKDLKKEGHRAYTED